MTPIIVTRLPLADLTTANGVVITLNERITDLCTVEHAAGYRLASTFVVGTDLVLIFELP